MDNLGLSQDQKQDRVRLHIQDPLKNQDQERLKEREQLQKQLREKEMKQGRVEKGIRSQGRFQAQIFLRMGEVKSVEEWEGVVGS